MRKLIALAVAALSLAAACGSDGDTVTKAPAADTAPIATEASGPEPADDLVEAPVTEASAATATPEPEPAGPTLEEAAGIDLDSPNVELIFALAADDNPAAETKRSCPHGLGGSMSHGSTVTIIVRDSAAGSTRTRTMQCQDGKWVTISDTTVGDAGIVQPPDDDDNDPSRQDAPGQEPATEG